MINFSIEKPLPISINSQVLRDINRDNNWVSQLKIDEHRSFIVLNGCNIEVIGWRGGTTHIIKLPSDTGLNVVFDGGIIKTTIFKKKPLIYVFDVLLIDDNRLTAKYSERFDFIIKNKISGFTYPELINNPIEEFNKLKIKKSKYVERLAKELKISINEAYSIVEGFVIKNVNGVLRYPMNKCESPNQLKLKL